jgi:hypothetical protein
MFAKNPPGGEDAEEVEAEVEVEVEKDEQGKWP